MQCLATLNPVLSIQTRDRREYRGASTPTFNIGTVHAWIDAYQHYVAARKLDSVCAAVHTQFETRLRDFGYSFANLTHALPSMKFDRFRIRL